MNTDTAWELWGQRDPYFGVLTDPKFRSSALTSQSKDEFFASGQWHVDYVLNVCRRHFDPNFKPERVLDFGCGVGRLVVPFCAVAKHVVGMDIAPSMLAEAERNCHERGVLNMSLVVSDDTLSNATGNFDLVHSCIVLQHIEVMRGRGLFALLVNRVKPGGFGALHVTFGWDIHQQTFGREPEPPVLPPPSTWSRLKASVRSLLTSRMKVQEPIEIEPTLETADPEMQMNYYNLNDLMFIVQQAGVQGVFTEYTNHGGALGVYLFFQKAETAT